MYYIYYNRHLKFLGGKSWEIKSYSGVSLATDENYENCCGRETIKFFRRVFGSKETTTRLTGGTTRHTSLLNNEKSEHYFIPISSELYDIIKDFKNKYKLTDFKKFDKAEMIKFIKNKLKTTDYYTDFIRIYIELYNKMYDIFFEFK